MASYKIFAGERRKTGRNDVRKTAVTSSHAPEGTWLPCFIEHLLVLHRLEFDAVRAYHVVAQSRFDFTGYVVQATDL